MKHSWFKSLAIASLGVFLWPYSQAYALPWYADTELPFINERSTVFTAFTDDEITAGTTVIPVMKSGTALGAVPQGQIVRFRVLLPPGTKAASVWGQSNYWKGSADKVPMVGTFDTDPGEFCPQSTGDGTSCGSTAGTYFYQDRLLTGSLSGSIYAGTPLPEARYSYIVLYNQPTADQAFSFTSLSIQIQIGDVSAYHTWRQSALGLTGGSVTIPDSGDTNTPTVDINSNPANLSTSMLNLYREQGHEQCRQDPAFCNISVIEVNNANEPAHITENLDLLLPHFIFTDPSNGTTTAFKAQLGFVPVPSTAVELQGKVLFELIPESLQVLNAAQ